MDRVEELNQRLYDRNKTTTQPQMLFSPRPISIKYNDFPMIDHYRPSTTPMIPYSEYNIKDDYLPSSCISPWNGYNVINETELRNLNQKLSKCPTIYMPKHTNPHVVGRKEVNTHPLLNMSVKMMPTESKFNSFQLFNNTTRAKNN
jgi:hypothetical protein